MTTWSEVRDHVLQFPGVTIEDEDGDPSALLHGVEFATYFPPDDALRIRMSSGERAIILDERRDPAIYVVPDDGDASLRITLDTFAMDELEEWLLESRRIAENVARS